MVILRASDMADVLKGLPSATCPKNGGVPVKVALTMRNAGKRTGGDDGLRIVPGRLVNDGNAALGLTDAAAAAQANADLDRARGSRRDGHAVAGCRRRRAVDDRPGGDGVRLRGDAETRSSPGDDRVWRVRTTGALATNRAPVYGTVVCSSLQAEADAGLLATARRRRMRDSNQAASARSRR